MRAAGRRARPRGGSSSGGGSSSHHGSSSGGVSPSGMERKTLVRSVGAAKHAAWERTTNGLHPPPSLLPYAGGWEAGSSSQWRAWSASFEDDVDWEEMDEVKESEAAGPLARRASSPSPTRPSGEHSVSRGVSQRWRPRRLGSGYAGDACRRCPRPRVQAVAGGGGHSPHQEGDHRPRRRVGRRPLPCS
jgi:hypothetical protein